MPALLNLRPAVPADATMLLEIQRAASTAAFVHIFPPDRYPFPTEAVRERWQKALADEGADVVVADVAGDAVGVALVRAEWLEGLYVVPVAWGTGVADALHDRALDLVRARGCDRCHLWVLEDNVRARAFYARRGWRENGTTRVVEYPPHPLDVGYTRAF